MSYLLFAKFLCIRLFHLHILFSLMSHNNLFLKAKINEIKKDWLAILSHTLVQMTYFFLNIAVCSVELQLLCFHQRHHAFGSSFHFSCESRDPGWCSVYQTVTNINILEARTLRLPPTLEVVRFPLSLYVSLSRQGKLCMC